MPYGQRLGIDLGTAQLRTARNHAGRGGARRTACYHPACSPKSALLSSRRIIRISKEFTSIVTDSLENYSQTGVTENTQLAQSTASQVAHSNQANITASVSGGIGFVSGSVSGGFTSQDSNSQSATGRRQHAIQTTRQASSRVKQSHKVTISTSTVTGTSETSTRMFENPSATDPMRVDYFSLMRKWYVALYRYGLRLTYDITIPEPGAAMREIYSQLGELQAQAAQGFTFLLKYSDITPQKYQDPSSVLWSYANQYGAQIQPPPEGKTQYIPSQRLDASRTQARITTLRNWQSRSR